MATITEEFAKLERAHADALSALSALYDQAIRERDEARAEREVARDAVDILTKQQQPHAGCEALKAELEKVTEERNAAREDAATLAANIASLVNAFMEKHL